MTGHPTLPHTAVQKSASEKIELLTDFGEL